MCIQYFKYVGFVVRDAFAFFVTQLSRFITDKYPKTTETVRTQVR